MLGPILEGDRVRLEPPAREHLPSIAKWRTDLEATRYLLIFQFPPAPKQHEEWLEKVAVSQDEIMWTVIDRRDGAVELRLREIRRRQSQDLVRASQLDVLAFELLEPHALVRRQPGPPAALTLGLPHPAP